MNTLLSSSRMSFLVNRHAKGQRIGSPPAGGQVGSGGTGETPTQLCTISGKPRLRASGREAHPKGAELLPAPALLGSAGIAQDGSAILQTTRNKEKSCFLADGVGQCFCSSVMRQLYFYRRLRVFA